MSNIIHMKHSSSKSAMSLITVVILMINVISVHSAASRGVTNEDIRDAVLSFVHMFRDMSDKLERHEYRERQLGEQLKKMIAGVDKRARDHENGIKVLADTLNKIEARMVSMETNLGNKNNREKETYTVDTINESIQSWMNNIEFLIKNQSVYLLNDEMQLKAVENGLNSKIDRLVSSVERLESIVLQPASTTAVDVVSYEGIMNKFTDKLSEFQAIPEVWHKNVEQKLDDQGRILSDLKTIADVNGQTLNHLTNKYEVRIDNNSTFEEIEKLKYELIRANDKTLTQLEEKLDSMKTASQTNEENVLKAVTESTVMTEGLYADVQKSYDQLSKDVKALSKVEQVLIQTADNVLDTKRRIEYGVHQILLEVGDLVKTQAKDLNTTLNVRFDNISETILVNHNGGFNNLSSKIETEISQVWRQIGIMYQQLTASADALDRLQQQTELYVNGSIQTMDSMEGKVGLITSRMTEVDDNLNYLLGRLSLVTHEFNQIKVGLGNALDNIKSSFQSVQEKVKDVGPGPNPIEDVNGDQDNALRV